MARTEGSNVKVTVDSTGGFVSVDWTCPHCGEYNAGFYFSSNANSMGSDFEIDHDCEGCGESVTIECRDAEKLF